MISSMSWGACCLQQDFQDLKKEFSSVQLLSHVRLFATPWTAAHQASLRIPNSWSLLKLMSIESVMPPTISSSVVPFSSHLQSFPASGSFQMSQFFASGGQSIGEKTLTKNLEEDFPDGPVVEDLPCNAGDLGLAPDLGTKIPHAVEQLRLHTTTAESTRHNQRVQEP